MIKIINRIKYDTDSAVLLGYVDYGTPGDFSYWEEKLYKKTSGEYFKYGKGGATSKYRTKTGQNSWRGSEDIIPLTEEEAKDWVEEYLSGEKYIELFGEVEENPSIQVSNNTFGEADAGDILSAIEESPDKVKLKKRVEVQSAFNTYTLVKQVGQGGNGRVFQATDKDGDIVAIKFLSRGLEHKRLKRFKNETFFCLSHEHKNIVSIYDYGTAGNDYIFYVMPFYTSTLRELMKKGIKHEDISTIFVGLLNGLSFAHKIGAIHRDIKPENILFGGNNLVPVIADFGIAHFTEDNLKTIVETNPKEKIANFQYAAPEQRNLQGKILPQTDIYSAGLILNEMFTGEIPVASGYKKIGDVNPMYQYLDALFDEIFKQNPEDRLYPEDSIIKRMILLADKYGNSIEAEKIRELLRTSQLQEENRVYY